MTVAHFMQKYKQRKTSDFDTLAIITFIPRSSSAFALRVLETIITLMYAEFNI